jgi:NDP-sugar pyrophosphorylase family protein
MAGKGQRFVDQGYVKPKPLIDVCGVPMIDLVLRSLKLKGKYIFITLKEHYLKNHLSKFGTVIELDGVTEGAVCTVLKADDYIKGELIIANCDQYLCVNMSDFLTEARKADGCIMTFNSTNPHHSYAKIKKGKVIEVAEKKVISDHASAGVYYFKFGVDFLWGAKQMMDKDIRTNNEFYICPVYQELIESNLNITNYEIDVKNKHMLGTPEELHIFEDKVKNKEVKL